MTVTHYNYYFYLSSRYFYCMAQGVAHLRGIEHREPPKDAGGEASNAARPRPIVPDSVAPKRTLRDMADKKNILTYLK